MKSNLLKYLFFAFVIGLIIFSVYTIYKDNQENEETEQKQTDVKMQVSDDLRIGIVDFDTINPILSKNRNVQEISRIVFDSLLGLSSNYKLEPLLATEWSKVDGNNYLLKLRDDVKFHNGKRFSARDVKYTIDTIKSNEVTSIYKENVKNISRVEVIDETTVKLFLEQEEPFFEYNLFFPIVSEEYYQGVNFAQDAQIPIGTGRYKITVEGDYFILKQNQYDWRNKEETEYGIKNINIYKYYTMGELYNSFKIGNIDLITTNSLNIEEYVGTIGYNKKEYKGRNYDFIAINNEHDVLQNKEVRKAVQVAIDRGNIISTIYNSKYYTADFPIDYNNWISTAIVSTLEYNKEQAEAILKDNGFEYKGGAWQKKEGDKTLKTNFTLAVNGESETRIATAENIKKQLELAGINITIKKLSYEEYSNALTNKNYDMILTGTRIGLSPNLNTYLGEGNFSNYNNIDVKGILNEVKNIKDENLLQEKYKVIYGLYKEDMPYISLYFDRSTVIYSTSLMGEVNPNHFNIFYNIEKWYRQ